MSVVSDNIRFVLAWYGACGHILPLFLHTKNVTE